jgi:nucleoside-diphosphate-sugar epimerase
LKNIAILGATSHIAKGLILNFCNRPQKYSAFLFARNTMKLFEFVDFLKISFEGGGIFNFDKFHGIEQRFDVLINCVGAGTPEKIKNLDSGIFRLTEDFDNLCIDYLCKNTDTLYINFSSGAVYGTSFQKAAEKRTRFEVEVNELKPKSYYGLAKLHSETKHRALTGFNIVDLRIFSYFSRFIDLKSQFFMSELVKAVLQNQVFETSSENFARDFVHPDDLFSLIECCIKSKRINEAFDVYSRRSVKKLELINFLASSFGLKYKFNDKISYLNATGSKNEYFTTYKTAEKIGYSPEFSSLDTIANELKKILEFGNR